jgi:hypothetical protein
VSIELLFTVLVILTIFLAAIWAQERSDRRSAEDARDRAQRSYLEATAELSRWDRVESDSEAAAPELARRPTRLGKHERDAKGEVHEEFLTLDEIVSHIRDLEGPDSDRIRRHLVQAHGIDDASSAFKPTNYRAHRDGHGIPLMEQYVTSPS